MTALIKFALTWCNPVWYLVMIPCWFISILPRLAVKLFWFPINTWNSVKGWASWGWNLFEPLWAKLLVASLAIFTVLPGTWTAVFFYLAHVFGYGKEADWVWEKAVSIASFFWTMGSVVFNLAIG